MLHGDARMRVAFDAEPLDERNRTDRKLAEPVLATAGNSEDRSTHAGSSVSQARARAAISRSRATSVIWCGDRMV